VDSKVPNLETPDGCTNIWMATVGYLQLGTFCPAPVATCTHLLLLGTTQKHHSSPPKSRSRHTTLRLTATSPEKVRFSPTTRQRYHLLGAVPCSSPLPSSRFIYISTYSCRRRLSPNPHPRLSRAPSISPSSSSKGHPASCR
jgi:hypothetical protein